MQPTQPPVAPEAQVLSHTGQPFDIRSTAQEPATAHEQTEADKEHAAAKLEIHSRETSPARLAPPTDNIEAAAALAGAEAQIEGIQLSVIGTIQKALITQGINAETFQVSIEKVYGNQSIEAVINWIKQEEGKIAQNPTSFALYKTMIKMTIAETRAIHADKPYLDPKKAKVPAETIEKGLDIAAKRMWLTEGRLPLLQEKIQDIFPKYLENVCLFVAQNEQAGQV